MKTWSVCSIVIWLFGLLAFGLLSFFIFNGDLMVLLGAFAGGMWLLILYLLTRD